MEYVDYEEEESIGVDINGNELQDGTVLRTALGESERKLYCVMQGETTGLYYLVALLSSVQDVVIKSILEAENYEIAYDLGQNGILKYRACKTYVRALKSL